MTISYRILQTAGDNRIEFCGQIYAEDELHEAIWLVNRELRAACRRASGSRLNVRSRSMRRFSTPCGARGLSPRISVCSRDRSPFLAGVLFCRMENPCCLSRAGGPKSADELS